MYVSPTMTNGFEMCGVLNADVGLWGLSRLLEAQWSLDGGLGFSIWASLDDDELPCEQSLLRSS